MTNPTLRLADDLALPLDAVTETIAILAKRGRGKTYTGAVLVEELHHAGLHAVVLDPVGVWWGLRVAADGTSPGLPIPIIGGTHADLPLEPSAGALIADLIIEEQLSCVLDLSAFSGGEQTRFTTDFAERLYQRNRAPLHLVLDEADAFAPQSPLPDQRRMLGAFEKIVRRGRARGLGVTMITQRPAVLNKNVLSQIEVLIALQLTAPQDRKALDGWISAHASDEQRAAFLDSLSSLAVGEAWIWSPAWLDLFQRVRIRRRQTFDSSATPKVGEQRAQPKALADVDLTALRDRLAATIEAAQDDDPATLRQRIAALEHQLQAAGPGQTTPTIERVEVPVWSAEQTSRVEGMLATINQQIAQLQAVRDDVQRILAAFQPPAPPPPRPAAPSRATLSAPRKAVAPAKPTASSASGLDEGTQALLAVFVRHYPMRVTRQQLASIAGRGSKSSRLLEQLRDLQHAGLLALRGELYGLTTKAREQHQLPIPQSRAEHLAAWRKALPAGPRKMLDVLFADPRHALPVDELARRAGFSPTSSSVGAHLRILKQNDLVEVVQGVARIRKTANLV